MAHQETLLRDVFGFSKFRPGQKEIVEVVAGGDNVLAIMPTGGGKSLCFQLPALLRDGVAAFSAAVSRRQLVLYVVVAEVFAGRLPLG